MTCKLPFSLREKLAEGPDEGSMCWLRFLLLGKRLDDASPDGQPRFGLRQKDPRESHHEDYQTEEIDPMHFSVCPLVVEHSQEDGESHRTVAAGSEMKLL